MENFQNNKLSYNLLNYLFKFLYEEDIYLLLHVNKKFRRVSEYLLEINHLKKEFDLLANDNKLIHLISIIKNRRNEDNGEKYIKVFSILFNFYCRSHQISNINLSHDDIGIDGGTALKNIIIINSYITTLNLSFNQLEEEGGKAIGNSLKFNSSIITINLSGNLLSKESGHTIGDGIKFNCFIKYIDLSGNQLGTAKNQKNRKVADS